MRKCLATLAIAGAVLLGWTGFADAHTPTVTPSCTSLAVNLVQYQGTNHVTITVDGAVIVDQDFGSSYSKTVTWTQTVDHPWIVKVKASDGPQFSFTKTGTQVHCQAPETTTTTTQPPATTTTLPPVTTTTQPATTTTVPAVTTTTEPATSVAVTDPPVPTEPVFTPADPVRPSMSDAPAVVNETPAAPVLPATGAYSTAMAIVALLFVLTGTALAFAAWRNKP